MQLDIKRIRAENGNLTQADFANRLEISLRTVQKYESGSLIPESIKKLIRYEFNLFEDERVEKSIFEKIDALIEKSNDKNIETLQKIKNTLIDLSDEKETYKNKYYITLEELDQLKTYLIKTLKIPKKHLS